MDSPARPSQTKMASSTGGTEGSSPASSPASAASLVAMAAPKYGTVVPNRIFVGGISASTSEAELTQLFSAYGNVKATKIIADRGGVSKGYGFVTFETEEEAKRLQQESECIILRERKLNIAPAIKKQPFNRSFDGGTGSPPAVPTSTYYYANGMGLPYQNGMTFYNAGAPAPGAAIAPPADPAALYQAAGVFGPQATASHQTFAPMMYPVPAPSLYMPQQYQYSPMPYEPYFPGTTAAGAPQFLYATNSAQATTSGSGNGSGTSSSGTAAAATGATSPASGAPGLGPSPPQFQAHFYGPASAASHPHHPGSMAGGPHGPPPPPPQQMEHLYFSYPPPPHAAQPPPHHGGPLALASDQQLLIYSTDMSGQPSANDSQVNQQEDSRSTSSHSEQQQLQPGGTATSDSGGGGGGGGSGVPTQSTSQPSDPCAPPTMLPLLPLKYLLPTRYPNYHPVANLPAPHSQANNSQQQQQPQPQSQQQPQQTNEAPNDDASGTPVHYRTMSIYPTPLYIPHHGAPYHSGSPVGSTGGASLLPTPPHQPYDLGAAKYRDYSAGKSGIVGSPYKGPPAGGGSPLLHHPSAYVKQYNGPPLQPGLTHHQKYPRVTTPPARLSHHPQYGKRANAPHHLAAPTYYFSQKSCQYGTPSPRPGQPIVYSGHPGGAGALSPYSIPHGLQKSFALGYESAGRRSFSTDYSPDGHSSRQSGRKNVNSYRGSNLTMSASASPSVADASSSPVEPAKAGEQPSAETSATATTTTTVTTTSATSSDSSDMKSSTTETQKVNTTQAASSGPKTVSSTPPPASYSPMTRPHPNLSPSPNPNQVQLFGQPSGGSSQRYGNSSSGLSTHHQRGGGSGSRYQMSSSSMCTRGGSGSGKTSSTLRQTSSKYKMNGIVQTSGKLPVDEANLGGAGDAPPRLPITPPTTPQQTTNTGEQQQLSETCHQMQALTL